MPQLVPCGLNRTNEPSSTVLCFCGGVVLKPAEGIDDARRRVEGDARDHRGVPPLCFLAGPSCHFRDGAHDIVEGLNEQPVMCGAFLVSASK